MKKIALIVVGFLMFASNILISQVENKVQVGLRIDPSINWLQMKNKRSFESKGVIMGFGGGLEIDIHLNNVVSLTTGIEYRLDGGKIQFTDSSYYVFDNNEFAKIEDTATGNLYQLLNRKNKIHYVNLPLNLKFRSPEFGVIRVYGLTGINLGFKVASSVDDEVQEVLDIESLMTNQEIEQLDNINNVKDNQFLNIGFQVGGGIDYNIAKSMFLTVGLKYIHNFVNINKSPSGFILQSDLSSNSNPVAFSRGVALSVGIIF